MSSVLGLSSILFVLGESCVHISVCPQYERCFCWFMKTHSKITYWLLSAEAPPTAGEVGGADGSGTGSRTQRSFFFSLFPVCVHVYMCLQKRKIGLVESWHPRRNPTTCPSPAPSRVCLTCRPPTRQPSRLTSAVSHPSRNSVGQSSAVPGMVEKLLHFQNQDGDWTKDLRYYLGSESSSAPLVACSLSLLTLVNELKQKQESCQSLQGVWWSSNVHNRELNIRVNTFNHSQKNQSEIKLNVTKVIETFFYPPS